MALLRVLDSADDELLAAPPAASEVAPPELGPHDAFRSVIQGSGSSRSRLLSGRSVTFCNFNLMQPAVLIDISDRRLATA